MVLNRSHIPWLIFVLVATAVATVLYLANFYPGRISFYHLPAIFGPTPPVRNTVGGTPLGLLFGSISLLIFLIAAGLGIRKKRRLWPIGHVQSWMRAHIWLTTLSIPLILFHCGFKFGGPMTIGLMVLYIVVMVSGFYGLALQQFMPGLMGRHLAQEAVYEAIPQVRASLVQAAEKLWRELAPREVPAPVQAAAEPHTQLGGHATSALLAPPAETETEEYSRRTIANFLQAECFPYLRAKSGRGHRLAIPAMAKSSFQSLRLNCTAKWQDQIRLMEQWCYDRTLLDSQVRMQHWLHVWLLVHVPVSFILLVVTFWHAFVTVAYL